MTSVLDLGVHALRAAYGAGALTVRQVIEEVLARIARAGDDKVWIARTPDEALRDVAAALDARRGEFGSLPLYGVPFAVKDNIDVAGLGTTAACPGFAYMPEKSATVVQRLIDAGAIVIGKTNLDQFATGLVGVRSPYGVPRNPFDPLYVPGGSSSGSAVAVSSGLVGFSLGSDTAGSGRIPAGFNNIVGLKPTPGLISTEGAVPACASLDCISIFALSCADASAVLDVAATPRTARADRQELPLRRAQAARILRRHRLCQALCRRGRKTEGDGRHRHRVRLRALSRRRPASLQRPVDRRAHRRRRRLPRGKPRRRRRLARDPPDHPGRP